MRRIAAVVVPIAVSAAAACATARPLPSAATSDPIGGRWSVTTDAVVPGAPLTLASRTLIPMRTLDLDPGLSLYDVVTRYWPTVLRPLVPATPASLDPRGDVVGLYVDGNFAGGQEQLRTIRASAVASIRRLTRSEEYARFGRAHAGGALLVRFR